MRSVDIAGGVTLTELGMGGSQLGNLGRESSDEQCAAAIDAAWQGGVRYFDTAPHYGLGLSERRLGTLLRAYPRSDFTISTKVGRLLVPTPERAAVWDDGGFAVPAMHRREWDFSRDGILRSIEGSLERLGMDSLDIAYLHDPDDHWEAASTTGIGALIELRDQGMVRAIGAGMNQSAMLADFVDQCDVDVVMLAGRYTLIERHATVDLLPRALERGVAVVAAGVYNSGLLSKQDITDDARFDYGAASASVLARARDMAAACAAQGVELPEAAIQFPLHDPAVVSVVIGARDGVQVDQALTRLSCRIPAKLWGEIDAIAHRPE
ncbi:MAG: aldo/keto reductase [Actinobacteria bacterium HGW-Actinobacteria-4]|nr:MAG: aldo/keto reductase [Actinobacteria bacterium HGW-Actinobacteria-4]